MYCKHLTLDEFRNYKRLDFELSPGVTVLQGDNASGKTSLLEAVYLLATTRSPRAGSDLELINFAAPADLGAPPFARVVAHIERERGPLSVEILIIRDELSEGPGGLASTSQARKRIKVNGVARRALDLVGQTNVVLFTPQDVDLVTGTPSMRRRYMDVTISQMDNRYIRLLSHYLKVLAQRNSLLKSIREQGRSANSRSVAEEMAYWDEELVKHGAYVVLRREVFAARLSRRSEAIHHLLVGTEAANGKNDTRQLLMERRPTAELLFNLSYRSDVAPEARKALMPELLDQIEAETELSKEAQDDYTASVDAALLRGRIPHVEAYTERIAEEFRRQLEEIRPVEVRRGMSTLGPHRDDLVFQLGELPLSAYGSRGQQRTAVLALKLAEVELMTAETGDTPILLLDDILSELDARRRSYLLSTLSGQEYQALITTADMAGFDEGFLRSANLLEVSHGEVLAAHK